MTKTHKQKPGRGNSLVFFVFFFVMCLCVSWERLSMTAESPLQDTDLIMKK